MLIYQQPMTVIFMQVGYKHCCFVVKLNDFESKRDCEETVSDTFTKLEDDEGKKFLDHA